MGDAVLKRAFQVLCLDYEELLDEAAQATQPADERIGLALFKIDEACAAADALRQDAQQAQEQLLSELLANCNELEDIFLRVNLIERFVGRMLQTTRELEKRAEGVSRAAGPVFNPSSSVTSLFRSFSIKRGAQDAPSTDGKWSPVAFEFDTDELMARLTKSDARELGVSISSTPPTEPAADEQAATGSGAESDSA
ncbi:Coagulation factor XI [Phytophthora cinnamomi]|uniref:Coagulation factor XI n=1 Tax=Phytophthora cinnamomi TaxID=4785 RepID=UPI0035599A68|nr:Coagulation factor XI [Phytophthora cinnamomi]